MDGPRQKEGKEVPEHLPPSKTRLTVVAHISDMVLTRVMRARVTLIPKNLLPDVLVWFSFPPSYSLFFHVIVQMLFHEPIIHLENKSTER